MRLMLWPRAAKLFAQLDAVHSTRLDQPRTSLKAGAKEALTELW